MSALCGFAVLAVASVAFLATSDPFTRVALAFALIVVSAIPRGGAARASLVFSLLYVVGLALFEKIRVTGVQPVGEGQIRGFLASAIASSQPLMVFLAIAGVLLRLQPEGALNLVLRIRPLRPVAVILAASAAQLRFLEYLTPTVWLGQWGRGTLRISPPWRRIGGLASVSVPLAVNFILDAERRGELAEDNLQIDTIVPGRSPVWLPRDPLYVAGYLLAGASAYVIAHHA